MKNLTLKSFANEKHVFSFCTYCEKHDALFKLQFDLTIEYFSDFFFLSRGVKTANVAELKLTLSCISKSICNLFRKSVMDNAEK